MDKEKKNTEKKINVQNLIENLVRKAQIALDEMMKLIKSAMVEAFQMDVPLKVDGAYASNWYDLK